jgi:hypothetical protein
MRAGKGSEYDGGHRVPFFMRWPAGGVGGGRDVSALTAHIDVMPTLLELCGVRPDPAPAFDGTSLAAALRGTGPAPEGRTLFVHSQRVETPVKWKQSAVMTERWRLVNGRELYDMAADPAQKTDVAAREPETVARLRAAYEGWWADLERGFLDVAIVLGDERADPVRLCGHDWHGERMAVFQEDVLKRVVGNGHWIVDVARAGRYRFSLRERPAEAPVALTARHAKVAAAGRAAEGDVPAGAESVVLVLDLPAGRTRLQTWLTDPDGTVRGAYYVEVKRE